MSWCNHGDNDTAPPYKQKATRRGGRREGSSDGKIFTPNLFDTAGVLLLPRESRCTRKRHETSRRQVIQRIANGVRTFARPLAGAPRGIFKVKGTLSYSNPLRTSQPEHGAMYGEQDGQNCRTPHGPRWTSLFFRRLFPGRSNPCRRRDSTDLALEF